MAVWTDVVPAGRGVWDLDLAVRRDFSNIAAPFAVLDWGPMAEDPQFNSHNSHAYRVAVDIHYVAPVGTRITGIRTKVEALADSFQTNRLTNALFLGISGYTWDESNRANQLFYAAQKPFVAGSLILECVAGEIP